MEIVNRNKNELTPTLVCVICQK